MNDQSHTPALIDTLQRAARAAGELLREGDALTHGVGEQRHATPGTPSTPRAAIIGGHDAQRRPVRAAGIPHSL
ncbi:hypothetical protein [Halomonas salifodinae]|uniref:hypothetical protein n=1 Tax=Halomonas salifodinae TaxID=438745 RepID=UPI0033A5F1B8